MKVTILLTAFAEPGKAPAQIRYSREAPSSPLLLPYHIDDLLDEAFEVFNAPDEYLTDDQRELRDSAMIVEGYSPSVGDFIILEREGGDEASSLHAIAPHGFKLIAEQDDVETSVAGILQLVAELPLDGSRRGLFDELVRDNSPEGIDEILGRAYLRSIEDLGEPLAPVFLDTAPEKAEEKPKRFADLPAGPISVELSREELGALFDLANVFEPGEMEIPGLTEEDSEEFAEHVGSAWNALLGVLNR